MDLTVLNTSFETVYILDSYESLLWVDKFNDVGAFEIYTPVTPEILEYVKPNHYLVNDASEHTMIVEDISIESDVENGNKIKIVGRSLESIMDRRIIWDETSFKEEHNFQKAIRKLVERNISSTAKIADRRIPNFILDSESQDASITALKLKEGAQYDGDILLEVVRSLCQEYNIGFKVILNEQNQFVFSLYNGKNRSYSQNVLPYVVYSPEFDNVISSNYREENSKTKNVALVVGGDGNTSATDPQKPTKRTVGNATGLQRRELHVNASDISKTVKQEDDAGSETTISDAQFKKLLDKRGKKELAEINRDSKTFDAQCDTTRLYVYGKDFFIGDIVQLANEYGMESESRVTEFTWSCSTEGLQTYPTFEEVKEEVEG